MAATAFRKTENASWKKVRDILAQLQEKYGLAYQKTLEHVLQVLMKNLKTLRNSKIRQMVKSHQLDCFNV